MRGKRSIPMVHIKYALCIYLLVIRFSVCDNSLSQPLSRSLYTFLSHSLPLRGSPPHANGPPPPHPRPHVYLIKNQLKTPRRWVSRAKPRLRVEQKRFPHSLALPHPLSPSLSLLWSAARSLSLLPKLRPPVYWKLATWFTRTKNLIYIFFSSCILSFIY